MSGSRSSPLVGVVVLNWNGLADTLGCLRSLAAVEEPRLDVIVVDNGSTGDDVERIRELHPDVLVIPTGANLGFAGGNNVGIEAALERGADAVLVLNNDTIVPADTIGRLVSTLDGDPDAGCVCPLILFRDPPDAVWFAGASFDPGRGRSGEMIGYRRRVGSWIGEAPVETDRGVGAAMLCSREAIEAAGLMDEDLFFLYEDIDWSLRMRACGFRILFDPGARIVHQVAASQNGSEVTKTTLYYLTRNHLTVCERHAPRSGVARLARRATIVAIHLNEAVRSGLGLVGVRAVVSGWTDQRAGRLGPAGSR